MVVHEVSSESLGNSVLFSKGCPVFSCFCKSKVVKAFVLNEMSKFKVFFRFSVVGKGVYVEESD